MFITFEGIDGAGKTTQIKLLARVLTREGLEVRVTREPGGTETGRRIRSLLLESPLPGPTALAELFLCFADRAEHMARVVLPALAEGAWVLCDRFADATVAYQGYGRGLDVSWIRGINAVVTQGVEPDLTFLLDCPPETGLGRVHRRVNKGPAGGSETRFEKEPEAFFQSVRAGYLELAASNESGRFRIVDSTLPREHTHKSIVQYVMEKAGGRWPCRSTT